jgi:hypothetical protein
MGWFGKKNSAVAEPVAEDDGHVLALFKKYDKDGNGTIESGELLQALAEMKVRRGGVTGTRSSTSVNTHD